jgi:hypothetical protein
VAAHVVGDGDRGDRLLDPAPAPFLTRIMIVLKVH